METNKFEKKLLDVEEVKKEKDIQTEFELNRLFENCIHGERSINEKVELEKFINEHKELRFLIKNKLEETIDETKDDTELVDFLREIKKDLFPTPDPNSLEGIGIIAKYQRSQIPENKKRGTKKYENRVKTPAEVVEKVILESNEKLEHKMKVENLLNTFNDDKSLKEVVSELLKSLKIYPELKDGYIKIVLDLYTKESGKDVLSYRTDALKKIWEFLSNDNL